MKKIRFIIIVIILLVFNTLYSFVTKEEKTYNANISSGAYANIGGMTNDSVIVQSFHCSYNNLSELSLRFATFGRVNAGKITYVISNEKNGEEVAKGTLDTGKITNNEFNSIKFGRIKDSKNKDFVLTMTISGVVGEDVVTIYSTESSKKAGSLIINGEKQEGTALVLNAVCKKVFDVETFIVLVCFEIYIFFFLKLLYKYLA